MWMMLFTLVLWMLVGFAIGAATVWRVAATKLDMKDEDIRAMQATLDDKDADIQALQSTLDYMDELLETAQQLVFSQREVTEQQAQKIDLGIERSQAMRDYAIEVARERDENNRPWMQQGFIE